MHRVISIVVEGQTERQFLESVMAPKAWARDIELQPIVVRTKRTKSITYKGGGSSWRQYRNLVEDLTAQHYFDRVGVMFDLYGCPADTPGYDSALTGVQLHSSVTEAVQQDLESIAPGRILAGPVLHETETLVIAAVATGKVTVDERLIAQAQKAIQKAGGNVEMVNGGQATAPSKRMVEWWPTYKKVIDGPRLLAEPPWEDIAAQCPTFNDWWVRLLTFGD